MIILLQKNSLLLYIFLFNYNFLNLDIELFYFLIPISISNVYIQLVIDNTNIHTPYSLLLS